MVVLSSLTVWALGASREAERKSEEALIAKQDAEASAKEVSLALKQAEASDSLRLEEERRSSIAKYNNYVERIKKELEVQLQVESYSYALAREYMTLAEELLKKNKDFRLLKKVPS